MLLELDLLGGEKTAFGVETGFSNMVAEYLLVMVWIMLLANYGGLPGLILTNMVY